MNLRSRGLNAQRALECCEREGKWLELALRSVLGDLLGQVLTAATRDDYNLSLVLVPGIGTELPRVIRITRGAPLVVGAIILLSAKALGSLIQQFAVMDALQGIFIAIDTIVAQRRFRCEACIRRFLWQQRNPLKPFCVRLVGRTKSGKRILTKHRRRMPGTVPRR